MPLTNEDMVEGGGHNWRHVWLNAEPSKLAEVQGSVTSGNDKVPALCGRVHVNHVGELIRVSEVEDHPDVESLLSAEDTCTECADRLREELGLELRELEEISGVGKSKAEALRRRGYHSPQDLRYASQGEIAEEVPEVGNALAARIKAEVGTVEED